MSLLRLTAAHSSEDELPGAELWFTADWLRATRADSLLVELREQVEWENHRIRLFGREVASPRLSCWIGDEEATYSYSGTRFKPHAWLPSLADLRRRLADELAIDFNSVLANLYRGGSDYMGWHSDNESELGPQPVIASISLGQCRRFVLKHRHESSRQLELQLPHGSLLVMRGDTQKNYRHALPRTARPAGERINLTFRKIFP